MTTPRPEDRREIRPRQVRRRPPVGAPPPPAPPLKKNAEALTEKLVYALNPVTGSPDLRRPLDPDQWEPGMFDIVTDPSAPPGVMFAIATPAEPDDAFRTIAKFQRQEIETSLQRTERKLPPVQRKPAKAGRSEVLDVAAENLKPGDLIAGAPSGLAVSKVTVKGSTVEVLFGERVAGGLTLAMGQSILIRRDGGKGRRG